MHISIYITKSLFIV